jgi:hypothetical protein
MAHRRKQPLHRNRKIKGDTHAKNWGRNIPDGTLKFEKIISETAILF